MSETEHGVPAEASLALSIEELLLPGLSLTPVCIP